MIDNNTVVDNTSPSGCCGGGSTEINNTFIVEKTIITVEYVVDEL